MKKNPVSIPHTVWYADDIRRGEREAADALGLTLYELMLRAGEAAFQVCRSAYPDARHWLVLCGHGNNGGDGYVVARLAKAIGIDVTLGTKMEYRTVALRHPRERAVFRIQQALACGFREFMLSQDFTEIHTPKITGIGAEGGAEVFELDYFGMPATLAQSSQMYKQTCVAFFDRVFEVGAVYRAELHNTSRHLNEYTGLDFEMGYIDGMEDVMQMETAMLQHTMAYVKEHCAPEIALLDVDVPRIGAIPCIRFADALALLKTLGGGKNRNDLTPEDEVLLCEYYREKGLGEFVFVTHFPTAKRPFYVMDDPHNPRETLSFDLLFRGLEVTTGGQRIHDYDAQVAKMQARGLDPAQFESYIGVHRCGLPPHGGLGIGLERLTMKLCGLSNIRDASLFPRDINHLVP